MFFFNFDTVTVIVIAMYYQVFSTRMMLDYGTIDYQFNINYHHFRFAVYQVMKIDIHVLLTKLLIVVILILFSTTTISSTANL